jgi:hypothetical protein
MRKSEEADESSGTSEKQAVANVKKSGRIKRCNHTKNFENSAG